MRTYNNFILEKVTNQLFLLLESDLHASGEFLDRLKEISKSKETYGKIAKDILDGIENDHDIWNWTNLVSRKKEVEIKQDFFNITDKEDTVSFLMADKIPDDFDLDDDASYPYSAKGRGEIKIGRILKYLLSVVDSKIKPSDKDIEKFVNAYKSSKESSEYSFELVSGDEIKKCYNPENYLDDTKGSLGGSCMNDEKKKMFNLYSDNPKVCQILLLKNSEDRIMGRALVWKLSKSPCDAKYFMDRCYTNRDSDEMRFKKYADKKGWLYKKFMNSHDENAVCFMYHGDDIYGEIQVELQDGDFKKYPYLDTLKFLDDDKTYLSNLPFKNSYILEDVFGGCDRCSSCRGKVLIHNDVCSSCGDGHYKLAEMGVKTDYTKYI